MMIVIILIMKSVIVVPRCVRKYNIAIIVYAIDENLLTMKLKCAVCKLHVDINICE